MLSRRAFIVGLTAAAALASRSALAAPAHGVRAHATDARGTTLTLDLAHAPFPHAGAGYSDSTVLVFVPRHFSAPRGGAIPMVVHFHGHNTTAERAIAAHQLREQLYDSKQNAILVVPQGPVMAPDSSAGKLEAPGGLARMLADVIHTLQSRPASSAVGRAFIPAKASVGRLCLSAHSGGYHAAAACLRVGGVAVREVYLFDALYAELDAFRDWVIAGKGKPMGARHKLVSYYTDGTTATNTHHLFEELERAGVECARETVEGTLSRTALTRAEAVSIKTQLSHGEVTSSLNSLRDCLYASALPRRLRTSWFESKHGARPLERRRR
jgi:hypothetical protein